VLIELDGDTARSEAQVVATLVRRETDPLLADVVGARCLDRLSCRDGEWRIDERPVVLDWHHVQPGQRAIPRSRPAGFRTTCRTRRPISISGISRSHALLASARISVFP
jgi:hypothetical protein